MDDFEAYKQQYPTSLALLLLLVCLLVKKKLLSRIIAQDNLLKVNLFIFWSTSQYY